MDRMHFPSLSSLESTERRFGRYRLGTEGKLWLLMALGLWATGVFKSINLLVLLGCFLFVLWCLNAFVVWRNLRRLVVRRNFEEYGFAGVSFRLAAELSNSGVYSSILVRLKDAGQHHLRTWVIPRLKGHESVCFQHEVIPPERGWYLFESVAATSGYPFGLLTGVVQTKSRSTLVFPKLGKLHRGRLKQFLRNAEYTQNQTTAGTRWQLSSQSEFHGLRGFRMGDSPRWIHWRTSARRGELMVREFEGSPSNNLIVVFDAFKPKNCPASQNELLERGLSLAATICWEWCRQTGDHLVLAVSGHKPVIVKGRTGRALALLTMECLALQVGCPAVDEKTFVKRLRQSELLSSPILAITTGPSLLPDLLANSLHHSVACVNVANRDADGFYEGPDHDG